MCMCYHHIHTFCKFIDQNPETKWVLLPFFKPWTLNNTSNYNKTPVSYKKKL